MPGRLVAVGVELTSVYAGALGRPDLVDAVAAARSRWPEATEVLQGTLGSLWRTILAPDDADRTMPPLDRSQKSWLLLHAGLLRGFNLALITAWRPTGDDLAAVDNLYPGFVAYGDALHASPAVRAADLSPPSAGDSRVVVDRVAAEARGLLEMGLRHGYGLGFLADAALLVGWPSWSGAAAIEVLAQKAAGRSGQDDRAAVATASTLVAQLDRLGRSRALAELMADQPRRLALESALTLVSRTRPLAVPSSIGRFSPAYVCTLLAYLALWWMTAGLRVGLREASGATDLPTEAQLWRRLPVRDWLGEQAHRWAREEVSDVVAVAGDPSALRWRLAELAQTMAAVGWELARRLGPHAGDRPTQPPAP